MLLVANVGTMIFRDRGKRTENAESTIGNGKTQKCTFNNLLHGNLQSDSKKKEKCCIYSRIKKYRRAIQTFTC